VLCISLLEGEMVRSALAGVHLNLLAPHSASWFPSDSEPGPILPGDGWGMALLSIKRHPITWLPWQVFREYLMH